MRPLHSVPAGILGLGFGWDLRLGHWNFAFGACADCSAPRRRIPCDGTPTARRSAARTLRPCRTMAPSAGKWALVVDDDPDVRAWLGDAFGSAGWDVAVASDGESAIESLRRRPYDLLIVDFRMAEIDGIEVVGHARAIRPGLPVVLISAYLDAEVEHQALLAGVDHILTKPFPWPALKTLLGTIGERAGGTR